MVVSTEKCPDHQLIDITALGDPVITYWCPGCGAVEVHEYAPVAITDSDEHPGLNSSSRR